MKFDGRVFGNKMGTGYTLNEHILFERSMKELNTMTNTESVITCEESAFLRVSINSFKDMADMEGAYLRGSSPHLMGDQDLMWEFFERHHFVKSI